MSGLQHIENLIDLSIEDDVKEVQQADRLQTNVTKDMQTCMEITIPESIILVTEERRESLDNNPFDFAQKIASRSVDPFDLVEKETCVKARYSRQPATEVKVGKLLSLSDENIIDDDINWHANVKSVNEESSLDPSIDNASVNVSSAIYHTALVHDLESESPPISMSIKSTPDSCSSAMDSEENSANSADGYSAKLRKALENRKRLLKLSLANSTFNSPLSCRSRNGDNGFSTAFSAAAHFSDYIQATESPLKLVEDDLLTEELQKKADAEKDFEADLKMLSIPMLRKLPSPVPEETSLPTKELNENTPQTVTPPDLSSIREKLRAKRIEACKGQDVVSLIDNLKSLLCENYIVDEDKKDQANCLLKKLSAALNTEKIEDRTDVNQPKITDNCEVLTEVPQTIVRQGTFDMELQPQSNDKYDPTGIISTQSGDVSPMTHSLQSTQSLSPPKEIPDVMVKSSATYDGEPVGERENFLLPYVETISPITSPGFQPVATSNPDVNDIIEQIGKLLEQHQIATQGDRSNESNPLGNNINHQSAMINPTFIVVMPTNSVQSATIQNVNTSICDELFEDIRSNTSIRRRSQSLSTHDKVKILKLPIRSQAYPSVSEAATNSPNMDIPSEINATTLKTPLRHRRNSFSSGTLLTPLTSLNQGASVAHSRRIQNAQISSRHLLGQPKLKEHENQQHAVVHPIPRTNLNIFKPDLKKRFKQNTTKSSIMSSNEPLKAMIPMKKVAPMLTSTLATPEGPKSSSRLLSHKVLMETSMRLLTKSCKISNTSTPMPPGRGGDQISDLPNACSTPAFESVAAKPSGTITKKNSRLSISTPTSKLHQPFTNCSGFKKRSLPELAKSKSPVRSRNSLAGISTDKGRQTTKQSIVSKQTTSRLNMRLSSRSSLCGGSASTNKENKMP